MNSAPNFNAPGGDASASYDASTGTLSFAVSGNNQVNDYAGFLKDLGFTPTALGGGTFGGDAYGAQLGGSPMTFSATLTH